MLSKVGDWNNLYIPDNREENAENASNSRIKTDIMIDVVMSDSKLMEVCMEDV